MHVSQTRFICAAHKQSSRLIASSQTRVRVVSGAEHHPQAADGIGQVAAALAIHNEWRSDLDANEFRLVYADDKVDWRNRELARGNMKR